MPQRNFRAQDTVRPAVGSELDSRTGMGLNCAARLGPNLDRECKRAARKGDYCVQHWEKNFGHEFNLLTWECKCGLKWKEVEDEICEEKIALVEFSQPGAANA